MSARKPRAFGKTLDTSLRKPRNCCWPEWVKESVVDQSALESVRS